MNILAYFGWYRRLLGGRWSIVRAKWFFWWVRVVNKTEMVDEEHRTWRSIRGMHPWLSVLLLSAASVLAAGPATPKTIWWKRFFDNSQFGGMTTNQFSTNVNFQVLSVTDCTIPTNSWPVLTNYQASTFLSFNGFWTNTVVADGATRFYLMRVGVVNFSSPFSDPFVWVPMQAPGIMGAVGP